MEVPKETPFPPAQQSAAGFRKPAVDPTSLPPPTLMAPIDVGAKDVGAHVLPAKTVDFDNVKIRP